MHWMLPEGIEEILPLEALRIETLRRKALDLFASWGYDLVSPPLIEFVEPLLTGFDSELDHKMFKFVDLTSGRLLGIRADITPQVSRIDARTASADIPSRLCYVGNVLHTHTDSLTRFRDPIQIGAEIYGHAELDSDIEVIRLLIAFLELCDLKQQIYLDIGHVGIVRGLASQAELNLEQELLLLDILQRKAGPELENFLAKNVRESKLANMIEGLLELNGKAGIIKEARDILRFANDSVNSILDQLQQTAELLTELAPSIVLNCDFSELRGYHYQTGLVFAAFVSGYGREVARGGRYDQIGKVFGRARPATGFSADLKLLSRLGEGSDREPKNRIFSPKVSDKSLASVIRHLRDNGNVVIEELSDQKLSANDFGCTHELVLQDNHWIVQIAKVPTKMTA